MVNGFGLVILKLKSRAAWVDRSVCFLRVLSKGQTSKIILNAQTVSQTSCTIYLGFEVSCLSMKRVIPYRSLRVLVYISLSVVLLSQCMM